MVKFVILFIYIFYDGVKIMLKVLVYIGYMQYMYIIIDFFYFILYVLVYIRIKNSKNVVLFNFM